MGSHGGPWGPWCSWGGGTWGPGPDGWLVWPASWPAGQAGHSSWPDWPGGQLVGQAGRPALEPPMGQPCQRSLRLGLTEVCAIAMRKDLLFNLFLRFPPLVDPWPRGDTLGNFGVPWGIPEYLGDTCWVYPGVLFAIPGYPGLPQGNLR